MMPEHDDFKDMPSIVQLTPDQMNEVTKHSHVKVKHILLAQNQEASEVVKEEVKKEEEKKKKSEDDEDEPDYKKEGGRAGGGAIFTGIALSTSDGLVVAFAIVGVFLVVAWIAAFPVMVYKSLKDSEEYDTHNLLSLQYSRFSETGKKDGELMGVRHSLFLTEPDEGLQNGNMGLTAEVGHYDHDRFGEYWLLGPSFILGFDMGKRFGYMKLDTLAGSTFDTNFGVVGQMDLSFNVELTRGLSLGVGFGGWYANPKRNETLRDNDQSELSFMYGAELTHLF